MFCGTFKTFKNEELTIKFQITRFKSHCVSTVITRFNADLVFFLGFHESKEGLKELLYRSGLYLTDKYRYCLRFVSLTFTLLSLQKQL